MTTPVKEWSVEDVVDWMAEVNAVYKKKYEDSFRDMGVDGPTLLLMDSDSLNDDLGITSRLHKKRLMEAVDELRKEHEESPAKKRLKTEDGPVKPERVKSEADAVVKREEDAKEEDAKEEGAKGEKEDRKPTPEGATPLYQVLTPVPPPELAPAAAPAAPPAPAAAPAPAAKPPAPAVPEETKSNEVEICFSFDTTGSMYACLGQVKRKIQELVERLLRDVPHMKIAIVAHGDYQDEHETYLLKKCNFSCDKDILVDWVQKVESTCGYDGDEAYEYVLREVKSLAWSPTCTRRALVMIGDSNPHTTHNNKYNIDWKKEAKALADMDVRIHGVHALGYSHSKNFYQGLAKISGGLYLELSQFSSIRDLILGVAMAENNMTGLLQTLEAEVKREGRMSRTMMRVFDALLERTPAASGEVEEGLEAVAPGRFQVLDIDEKVQIKEFALSQGLIFKTGRGFYEFTKPEKISMKKEIVLQKKDTGDFFTGDKAREMLGISDATANKRLKPTDFDEYRVFVQSTSYNRNLMPGTKFLYEVDTDH